MKTSHRSTESSKTSFIEQRMELSAFAIEDLYKSSNRYFYSEEECIKNTFGGYYLFALDELEIKVPATAENIEEFGDILIGGRKECHMRLDVITDLRNHMIVDCGCNPYLYPDRNESAARQIAGIPGYIGADHPYIILLDRSYDTVPLITRLMAAGQKFAVRLKEDGFLEDKLSDMDAGDRGH